MTEPVRIFLVDDHALFRSGVRAELDRSVPDVTVVGEAGSVAEAVAGIAHLKPDVVLLDVHMPDGGGAEVLRRVRVAQPDVVFLALSVSDAAEDVIAIIRAGARGYVMKSIAPDELVDAIRRVHDGDAVFSPRLAGFVLDAFAGAPPPPRAASGDAGDDPEDEPSEHEQGGVGGDFQPFDDCRVLGVFTVEAKPDKLSGAAREGGVGKDERLHRATGVSPRGPGVDEDRNVASSCLRQRLGIVVLDERHRLLGGRMRRSGSERQQTNAGHCGVESMFHESSSERDATAGAILAPLSLLD